MKPDKYDFGGYATKNDIVCTDGRVIRQDAFKHDDGRVVPLVWQHGSNDPSNLIGHAVLENREDGVYAYATFNGSSNAENTKDLVKHGAINALSIHANKLGQIGKEVLAGVIREVSLVMSGANPGAYIDTLAFEHNEFGEEVLSDEAIIYSGESITISHSDEPVVEESVVEPIVEPVVEPVAELVHAVPAVAEPPVQEKTIADVLATLSEDQKVQVGLLIDSVDGELNVKPDETVLNALDDEQKAAVGFLIGELEKDNADQTATDTSAQHSEMENDMKSNVFDQNGAETETSGSLTHEDFVAVMELSRKTGSFKDAFIQHMEESGYELQHRAEGTYGLDNIGVLFPDARSVTPTPEFVKRDTGWVATVMNGTKHSPFAKIKSLSADITEDEARAKGYITGTEKANEVFALLSRSTDPTTIYKKQKLDRDDILDITDFDVVMWLRSEMRLMLDEEVARAILIGDGRLDVNPDKIKEDRIRPIYLDAALYATRVEMTETDADHQIDEFVRGMKNYKGSGNPTLFASIDKVTDLLLVKDALGRRMYASKTELAAALRVSNIVEVEVMNDLEHPDSNRPLFGIVVNLSDYTVGTDKGGDLTAFDDFDINFNQYHYLIEARMSGALTKPLSAVIFELHAADEEVG